MNKPTAIEGPHPETPDTSWTLLQTITARQYHQLLPYLVRLIATNDDAIIWFNPDQESDIKDFIDQTNITTTTVYHHSHINGTHQCDRCDTIAELPLNLSIARGTHSRSPCYLCADCYMLSRRSLADLFTSGWARFPEMREST